MKIDGPNNSAILLYQTEGGQTKLEVHLVNETVSLVNATTDI